MPPDKGKGKAVPEDTAQGGLGHNPPRHQEAMYHLQRQNKSADCSTSHSVHCHLTTRSDEECKISYMFLLYFYMEWYSDRHDNLMDNVRLAEEKVVVEHDHCQKADEKLVQANSRIVELEAKLMGLQRELTVLQKQDKRTPIN